MLVKHVKSWLNSRSWSLIKRRFHHLTTVVHTLWQSHLGILPCIINMTLCFKLTVSMIKCYYTGADQHSNWTCMEDLSLLIATSTPLHSCIWFQMFMQISGCCHAFVQDMSSLSHWLHLNITWLNFNCSCSMHFTERYPDEMTLLQSIESIEFSAPT